MSYHTWRQTVDMSFMLEIVFNKICIIFSLYIQAVLYSVFPELKDITYFDASI